MRTAYLAVGLMLIVAAAGCKSGGPAAPPTGAALVIDAEPDAIAAPWRVSGPGGFQRTGNGDRTFTDVGAGTYTVMWLDVAGRVTPAAAQVAVVADSTATVMGTYLDAGVIFPDTPDKLMQNFLAVYEAKDAARLVQMLHPDHVTLLQQETMWTFPDVGPTLDVTEETRIHERMFSGHDVTDPDGLLVPGISAISFEQFARAGVWSTSPPTDAIPDALNAQYDVVVAFDRGQTYSTMRVQGSIRFYVAQQDSVVSGVARPYYRLLGQRDQTLGAKAAASENSSWGSVKALFR